MLIILTQCLAKQQVRVGACDITLAEQGQKYMNNNWLWKAEVPYCGHHIPSLWFVCVPFCLHFFSVSSSLCYERKYMITQ